MAVDLLVFFLILSLVVLIHEFGHFVAARFFGITVEEFGFGLPPRLKKLFHWQGTLFSWNWLPIGGFVKLKGEEADALLLGEDVFYRKPIWQRAIVLVAGVIGNFLLGVVLFAIIYSVLGIPTKTDKVRVVEVGVETPAEQAGIKKGDTIKQFSVLDSSSDVIDGQFFIDEVGQLVELIDEHRGEEIKLLVVGESGKERELQVVPRVNPPDGEGALGIALTNVELIKYSWWQMPFRGMVVGIKEALAWGMEIVSNLWLMIYGLFTGQGVPGDVAGPVGIYQISSQVYRFGLLPLLQFVGVLSINLAVLNIAPFPALDGGRLIFLGIERLMGQKLKNKFESSVHAVGMAILLVLLLMITIRDIMKLF